MLRRMFIVIEMLFLKWADRSVLLGRGKVALQRRCDMLGRAGVFFFRPGRKILAGVFFSTRSKDTGRGVNGVTVFYSV